MKARWIISGTIKSRSTREQSLFTFMIQLLKQLRHNNKKWHTIL